MMRVVVVVLLRIQIAAQGHANGADERMLLDPDEAGAVRVFNVPFPNDVLNGVYFPTATNLNSATAYKKDPQGQSHPHELWLTLDPNGYWCIQPSGQKGTSNSLMISAQPGDKQPEHSTGWQLWKDDGWKVDAQIEVTRCANNVCDASQGDNKVPPPAVLPVAPVPLQPGVPVPTPAPRPRAFDNSPGRTVFGTSFITKEQGTAASYQMWAMLVLGGLLLIFSVCCLVNGSNKVARSYVFNVMSQTVVVEIGVLLASQFVPFVSYGYWRTCWTIELIIFILGLFTIHFTCWKGVYSPYRRTCMRAVAGPVVGCFGAAAFVDGREAGNALLSSEALWNLIVLLITCVVLVAMHYILKSLDNGPWKDYAEDPWPAKPSSLVVLKEDGKRSCMSGTRSCLGEREEEEDTVAIAETEGTDWVVDAIWAEYSAMTLVLAVAIYSLIRCLVNLAASRWHNWLWLLVAVICIGVMVGVHEKRKRDGDPQDAVTAFLLVATTSRILGLCAVGAMRMLNPGLVQQIESWFGLSTLLSAIVMILMLSYIAVLIVVVLSRIYKDADGAYGYVPVIDNVNFPQEVVGMALMLGIAWGFFSMGMIGDMARFSGWLNWHEVWVHALMCVLWAGILFLVWRSLLLPRAEMTLLHHEDAIEFQKKTYDDISSLKTSW